MLALGLVLLGVITTIKKEKYTQHDGKKPRAVARPEGRPLVVAVGTFGVDIPNQDLHWLRYAFSDSLSRNLDKIEGIQVIDREIVAQLEAKLRPGEDLGRYAGALGADLVIGGEVWQQESNVIGVTGRALSPVDIFFAEEVAPESEVFALSALLAGYIAGTKVLKPWAPSSLSSYQRFIELETSNTTFVFGALDALLEKDPDFVPALYRRSQREHILGSASAKGSISHANALRDAERALQLEPDNRKLAAFLASLSIDEEPLRALWVVLPVLKQAPDAAQLRYQLARSLFAYGLFDDAKLQLAKILASDDSAGPAWQLLSWIALLQKDPKAPFYARHALAVEERWRAEDWLSTSALRGWARIKGSRVYVVLAERETLSKEERETLLQEDLGLYPNNNFLASSDSFLQQPTGKLREFLVVQGSQPDTSVSLDLLEISAAPQTLGTLPHILQLASVAVISEESPEMYLQIADALAQSPKEMFMVKRWRELNLSGDDSKSDDWLLQDAPK
jgi:tetratricopeptide (TPR) repeat protein